MKNFNYFIALSLSLLLTNPVFAGAERVYPGSLCKPANPYTSTYEISGHSFINTSNSNLRVYCPALEFQTNGLFPKTSYVKGSIRITNPNASKTSCGLSVQVVEHGYNIKTANFVGPSPDVKSYYYGSLIYTNYKQLDIGPLKRSPYASYDMYCTLPPGAEITKYFLHEY